MIKSVCLKCRYHKVFYHKNIEPGIYCNYNKSEYRPIEQIMTCPWED